MSVVIRVVAFADDTPCPIAGQYVKTFDHEAANGRGFGEFTHDIKEAMQFPSLVEAGEFWKRVPKCKPTRPDGKPNRPLTSTTVEIIRPEEAAL